MNDTSRIQNKIVILLMFIIWGSSFLVTISNVLANYSLVSGSFYTILSITGLLVILIIFNKNYGQRDLFGLILIFFIILTALVAVIKGITFIHFNYFKNFLLFSCMNLFLYISVSLKFNKYLVKFIVYGNMVVSLILILYSFYPSSYNTFLDNALQFGFSNTNAAGLFIFINIIYLVLGVFVLRGNNIYKYIAIPISVYLYYLLYLTDTRSSLMAVTIFLLMTFFFRSNKKISKVTITFIALFPLIFVGFYVLQYLNISHTEQLVMGKSIFSGRERIWLEIIMLYKENPFGSYYGLLESTSNIMLVAHNAYIYIILRYGLIVFILFFIFLMNILMYCRNKSQTRIQNVALWGLLAIIIQNCAESTIFEGGLGLYIPVYSLVAFIKYFE
jgi:hypothetical protein